MYIRVYILFIILIILFIFSFKYKYNETFKNHSIPIYVSVTSINKNQKELYLTLNSIINQSLKPNKIFIFLSESPYILDTGFKNERIDNKKLKSFLNENKNIIEVKWVDNIGSYRKLLPLLKEKWNENCIIITIDDDTIYDEHLIKNLVSDYNIHKCVINYRGFTPKMNKLDDFDYNIRDKMKNNSLYNFPTGKGGVLYKPEFFKKTGTLIFDDKIYKTTCDKQDDIWFYIVRILNNVNCYIDEKKWIETDITNGGLYFSFNSKNNNNTKAFHKSLNMIKDKDKDEYNYNL